MTHSAPAKVKAHRDVTCKAPRLAFLGATWRTLLKPRFRKALRPIAAHLAKAGITANQVTVASVVGSVLVSALLCSADNARLFAILPVWLLVRIAGATIDGILAIEFGQKGRLGGILNEVGDIVSDIALFLPFMFIVPFSKTDVGILILLAVACELVGMAAPLLGSDRRLEGPLGKADRSIALGTLAVLIVAWGQLPANAWLIVPVFVLLMVVTLWNRIRFAIAAGLPGSPSGSGRPGSLSRRTTGLITIIGVPRSWGWLY